MKHRLLSSIAMSIVAVAVMIVPTLSASASAKSSSTVVTFRSVLCFAPALATKTEFPSASALPTCRSKFDLTAKNLDVTPGNSAAGFTSKTIQPDPRFVRFRSTSGAKILSSSDLLLPMIHANAKSERLVVGPAQLTGSAVKSAKAFKISTGEWVVSFRLTSKGSAAWNAYAKRQFHALIAIVANGEVYSAPLIQPASTRFTSFGGTGEISGRFTKADAVDLAKWLVPKK